MIGSTSSMQAGLNGIHNGLQQFQQSAAKIAAQGVQTQGTDLAELAEASVGLLQAENQVAASTRVVKSSDEIMGSLIDIMA